LAVEGRLLIHRGFTGHACRPHEKSGLAAFYVLSLNIYQGNSDVDVSLLFKICKQYLGVFV
ncbi:hypothetical protein, partial [Pseudomonas helleri]|uniref:hypothetical protein n=1 Tax=Pseudomonas helleri TaxID=1608996 RepID=UPI001E29706F